MSWPLSKRPHFWFGLGVLGLSAALTLPASAQFVPFRFVPPPALEASGDQFIVQWTDVSDNDFAVPPTNITWYYAASREGTDRKRLATVYRDDFSNGFLRRWKPSGPFLFDWTVQQERNARPAFSYLKGGRQSGPILYNEDDLPPNAVISIRVRPTGIKNEFGLGFRTQADESGYELRNNGLEMVLREQGKEMKTKSLGDASIPNRWYWYEVSCRNQGMRGIEIRVRVYDDKHQNLLVSFDPPVCRPGAEGLRKGRGMALWGPADIAEVYVDTWDSRWVDGRKNQLTWDLSAVPAGKYYLIAEVEDGSGKTPARIPSPFQVEVRKSVPIASQ